MQVYCTQQEALARENSRGPRPAGWPSTDAGIRIKDVFNQPLVSLKGRAKFQVHSAARIPQVYPDLAVSLAWREAQSGATTRFRISPDLVSRCSSSIKASRAELKKRFGEPRGRSLRVGLPPLG